MLKGVNKSIIEINLTDSGYFERAILFVKPEQSGMSQKRLQGEAEKYINSIGRDYFCQAGFKPTVLKNKKKNGNIKLLSFVFAGAAVAVALVIAVLNIL